MLIALEGLDQSGKETQARHLRARIQQQGRTVRSVSFPDYDTPIGLEIKRALAGEYDYTPEVMQLLYIANRFEYKPRLDLWLSQGDVVICDRYRASSVAYGAAQGVDAVWMNDVQRLLPPPAATVLLDVSPETAAGRKASGRDRYERDLALLRRVRESYRQQAAADGWTVVDGSCSKDDVAEAVARAILPLFARRSKRGRR